MEGISFRSTLFEIEPGEDDETNPRIYGKQLAQWLKGKFEALGYQVEEIIPEDWGWCVMCQRQPFNLWIGCKAYDYKAKANDPPPLKDQVVWYCFVVAEPTFLQRIFGKTDVHSDVQRLWNELRELLQSDPGITEYSEH